MATTNENQEALEDIAYAAFDRGALTQASQHFAALLERHPDHAGYHYMQGLVHKYLRDWPTSLRHNLRSQELRDEFDASSAWNAGIAATALGEWQVARAQWRGCGIRIPDGNGPIEDDFGVVSIRLNAWGQGETVFARRIDIVRARLLNVPLPESGYRLFDIVLHDGARTGERELEDGHVVPVFNALARLGQSEFRTFAAFVSCGSEADIEELLAMTLPGIGHIEDWTSSIAHYCLRCSYGTPHRHAAGEQQDETAWQPDRNLGIGAQSRAAVARLLEDWAARGDGRHLDGIEAPGHAIPEPDESHAWWREPDPEDDEGQAAEDT